MSERFFVDSPLSPGPIVLEGTEAHHLAAVRRLRPGERVCLFNGDGHEYPAVIRSCANRRVNLDIVSFAAPDRELSFLLEVAAPLPKGDRVQHLLEKLTELGATRFVPLQTERSVIAPGQGKMDKLRRYVVEASKQCGRNKLLAVEPLTDWQTYCKRSDLPTVKQVAHPGGMTIPPPCGTDTVLAVGPEGGFTDKEVALARETGWTVVGLGPRVLRIETAAIALTAVHALFVGS